MKIKGLHKFISEVNDPKSGTTPDYRIQLELVKIKKSLLKKKKKKMYNTKKCIAKLCYIELYGCHVTFGYPQILTLLRSHDLSDNFFGCLGTVILFGDDDPYIMNLIPEMRRLLTDMGNDLGICFALNAISCIDNAKLADSLGPTIADIVIQPNVSEFARKKAMLTLAKIYQSAHQYPSIDRITPKLSSFLLSKSTGIVQCASTLILSIIQSQPASIIDFFPVVIDQLYSIINNNEYDKETVRGKIPCPFLTTKLFRILNYKSYWTESDKDKVESVVTTLLDLIDLLIGPPIPISNSPLATIISRSSSSTTDNHSSYLPSYMIFSEISDLAASVPFNISILDRIINRFIGLIDHNSPFIIGYQHINFNNVNNSGIISHPKRQQEEGTLENNELIDPTIKEVDLSFFAIDKLNLIVRSVPLCSLSVQPIQNLLFKMMQKRNVLVDVRALDLLYAIATSENSIQIAQCMIDFMPKAPLYLRESLATKATVLIQSYGSEDLNNVSVLIKIVQIGGKELNRNEVVWRTIVQMLALKKGMQREVTENVYSIVKSSISPNFAMVKLSAYLIGEYCHLCESSFSIKDAVDLLILLFNKNEDESCQSMILTALMKLVSKSSEVKMTVKNFFRKNVKSLSYEVSQRSREFVRILSLPEKVMKKLIVSSNSNTHVVSEIFTPKTVIGEIPQNGFGGQFDDRHDLTIDESLLNQFQKDDTGTLLKSPHFIIRAAVRYEQPRLFMIVNIENLTSSPIVIKNFSIDSSDELRFRIVDLPFSIDSNDRTSVQVDFVMMDMTNRLPVLNLTIAKSIEKVGNVNGLSEKVETVSTPLPIFFNRWFLPFEIDEESFVSRWASIVDPLLVGEVQLVIPDGDVIEQTVRIMKEKFGLEPLKFKIAENNVVYAGAFKCFNGTVGVLLRFVYDEEKMDFSFHVKANMKSAVKFIIDVTRTAFLS